MSNLKRIVRRLIRAKTEPDYFDLNQRKKMIQEYIDVRKDRDGEDHVPKEPTFWSTFTFKGQKPQNLHCTHKFFGELEEDKVREIMEVLDKYFEENPFKKFKVKFHKEEMFGPEQDIRVLRPDAKDNHHFHLDLKKELDKIVEDKFPVYKPHTTTPDLEVVELPIDGYSFIYGDTVLKRYE